MDRFFSPFSIEESTTLFGLAGYDRENAVDIQRGNNWISKMKLILSLKAVALRYQDDADDLNRVASIIFSQM